MDEPAHLHDPRDRSFVMHRYPPAADLAHLVRRYWIPVWDVPAGPPAEQKVLQYPVCLLSVTADYGRFIGPNRGMTITALSGRGWAFGVMFQPAAGGPLFEGPVSGLTDGYLDLGELAPFVGLADEIRAAMTPEPLSVEAHQRAQEIFEARLRTALPTTLDPESLLINRIVDLVEAESGPATVDELCAQVGIAEWRLQRLTSRRLGLTPLWLIRRRRLHEASARLRAQPGSLADLAAELGYADQAHFSRDFRMATGMTPTQFRALTNPALAD